MVATHTATVDSTVPVATSTENPTVKVVHKTYEGLVTVRTKAIIGKGAWYWVHLEPILVHNSDIGLAKAVKLKCSLCHVVFSASNPSQTASKHLKRGTCSNFTSVPKPISTIPTHYHLTSSLPSPSSSVPHHNYRERSSSRDGGARGGGGGVSFFLLIKQHPLLWLIHQDSVLTDWLYESCGSISFSSVENPKFKAFLN